MHMSLPNWQIQPWGYSAFFADANRLFALIPKPTNHCITIMQLQYTTLYGTIININGGSQNGLYMLDTSFGVPSTKRQCSRGVNLVNTTSTIT